jgi:hypothetical protein
MFGCLTHTPAFRAVVIMVIVAFVTMIPAQSGYSQSLMPKPGVMINTSASFEPALMVGLKVDVKNPFNLSFIVDKGQRVMPDDVARQEYQKLIKYFLASLAITNKDMWVNLSPHESNRIIPDNFIKTEMGRDLLAQDYILKQFTASLMYPEGNVGKEFWRRLYAQVYERYGTTDIPTDTFNKVWISADQADIYQKNDTSFLVKSHLKVMLEEDFMAVEKNKEQFGSPSDALEGNSAQARAIASDVVREVIIPFIEKEVNEGENFAQVRQIYSAMILATWYKKALRESLLGQVYADQNKVGGIELNDPGAKTRIYEQYLDAYKVGVFNYIKEEADPLTSEVLTRKYFSGGASAPNPSEVNRVKMPGKEFLKKIAVTTAFVVVATVFSLISGTPTVQAQEVKPVEITQPMSAYEWRMDSLKKEDRRLKERLKELGVQARQFKRDWVSGDIDREKVNKHAVLDSLKALRAEARLTREAVEDTLYFMYRSSDDYLKSMRLVDQIDSLDLALDMIYGRLVDARNEYDSERLTVDRLTVFMSNFKNNIREEEAKRELDIRNLQQWYDDLVLRRKLLIAQLNNENERYVQWILEQIVESNEARMAEEKEAERFAEEIKAQELRDEEAKKVAREQMSLYELKRDSLVDDLNDLDDQYRYLKHKKFLARVLYNKGFLDYQGMTQDVDAIDPLLDEVGRKYIELFNKIFDLDRDPPLDPQAVIYQQAMDSINGIMAQERVRFEELKEKYQQQYIDLTVPKEQVERTRQQMDVMKKRMRYLEGLRRAFKAGSKGAYKKAERILEKVKAKNPDGGEDMLGGINLSDEHLTMNIKVDGQGIPLSASAQDPAMMNIQGLSPVIREIVPLSSVSIPVISEMLAAGSSRL